MQTSKLLDETYVSLYLFTFSKWSLYIVISRIAENRKNSTELSTSNKQCKGDQIHASSVHTDTLNM